MMPPCRPPFPAPRSGVDNKGCAVKMLKVLLGAVAAPALLLVGGGLLLSGDLKVTRSIEVAAPADKVCALVQDPRR